MVNFTDCTFFFFNLFSSAGMNRTCVSVNVTDGDRLAFFFSKSANLQ